MKPQHTPGLLKQLQYIANKAHTLAGWKLEPGGHDVNIAELQEIEIKANKSIVDVTILLQACKAAKGWTQSHGGWNTDLEAKLSAAIAKAEGKE